MLLKEDCINFINTEMEIKGLGNTKHTTKMPKWLLVDVLLIVLSTNFNV